MMSGSVLDFMFLMHGDAPRTPDPAGWDSYFAALRARGVFDGGSSIGAGRSVRRHGDPAPVSGLLTGYIRVRAASAEAAIELLDGNPVYEAGGTIEIRELPRD